MTSTQEQPPVELSAIAVENVAPNEQVGNHPTVAPVEEQQRTQICPLESPGASHALQLPVTCLQASNPDPPLNTTKRNPMAQFLFSTSVGNAIAILGFPAILIGLSWGIFNGIVDYRDIKWSEHNDLIQTCASLYSIGQFSKFCNKTIKDGVAPVPVFKRWIPEENIQLHVGLLHASPIMLVAMIALTVAAIIGGIIFSRPQMQPFPPATSSVRLEPEAKPNSPVYSPYAPTLTIVSDAIRAIEAQVNLMNRNIRRHRFAIDVEPYHVGLDRTFDELNGETGGIGDWVEWENDDARTDSAESDELLPKVLPSVELSEQRFRSSILSTPSILSTVTPSILSSGRFPPLIQDYFSKMGDISIIRERLSELETEHVEERAHLLFQSDRGIPLELSEQDFEDRYTRNHTRMESALNAAVNEAELAKAACLNAGLYPEAYRRPYSRKDVGDDHILSLPFRAETPDILRSYRDAVGTAQVLKDNLYELDVEHSLQTAELEHKIHQEHAIESDLEELAQEYEYQRLQINEQLAKVKAKAKALREGYISEGINPYSPRKVRSESSIRFPPVTGLHAPSEDIAVISPARTEPMIQSYAEVKQAQLKSSRSACKLSQNDLVGVMSRLTEWLADTTLSADLIAKLHSGQELIKAPDIGRSPHSPHGSNEHKWPSLNSRVEKWLSEITPDHTNVAIVEGAMKPTNTPIQFRRREST